MLYGSRNNVCMEAKDEAYFGKIYRGSGTFGMGNSCFTAFTDYINVCGERNVMR